MNALKGGQTALGTQAGKQAGRPVSSNLWPSQWPSWRLHPNMKVTARHQKNEQRSRRAAAVSLLKPSSYVSARIVHGFFFPKLPSRDTIDCGHVNVFACIPEAARA